MEQPGAAQIGPQFLWDRSLQQFEISVKLRATPPWYSRFWRAALFHEIYNHLVELDVLPAKEGLNKELRLDLCH